MCQSFPNVKQVCHMRSLRYFDSGGQYDVPSACQHDRPSTHWSTHMTTKETSGVPRWLARRARGCRPAAPHPTNPGGCPTDAGATASSLPVRRHRHRSHLEERTNLSARPGRAGRRPGTPPRSSASSMQLHGERTARQPRSINEAVAGAFPSSSHRWACQFCEASRSSAPPLGSTRSAR